MKCEYCGTELKPDEDKCPGCFAAVDKTKLENSVEQKTTPQINENNNSNSSENQNLNQDNKQENKESQNISQNQNLSQNETNAMLNNQILLNDKLYKENKKDKNLIAILFSIIIGLVVFGISFFVLDGKTNNYNLSDDPKYQLSNETITIGNYTFSIPNGWKHGKHDNYEYLQGNECMIIPTEYSYPFEQILNNKKYFEESIEKQGYKVNSFKIRKIDGIEYLVAVGSLDKVGYGFMFSDLGSDKSMFLTIVSNTASEFDEEWFNYGSIIVKNAKKVN